MRGAEPTTERVRVSDIFTTGMRRPLKNETVSHLAESIKEIGLQHPITIRYVDYLNDPVEGELHGAYVLVAGLHRLTALKSLGHEWADCRLVPWNEDEARRWEIAENLHRAELTTLERAEQIAEWIRLTEKLAQVGPVLGGRGNEGGLRAAVRDLGLKRTSAQRAIEIDSITPEAKAEGASLSQQALLRIAKAAPAQQVDLARQFKQAPPAASEEQAVENQVSALMNAWNKAGPEARDIFLGRVA